MKTLDLLRASKLPVPASTAWYLETLGEFRGKQELFTRQACLRAVQIDAGEIELVSGEEVDRRASELLR
jgi:hypothetical protein